MNFSLDVCGVFFLLNRKWLFMQLQKNKSTKEVVETIGHSALSNRVTSHLHHDFLTGKERSSEAQNNSKPLIAEMQEYVLKELEVCSNAAAKYPNNYNAWSHRIWLIRNICHSNEEVGKAIFRLIRAYSFTKLWHFNCSSNRQWIFSFCTRYWIQKFVIHLAGWQEISPITVATTTDSSFFIHVTIWTKLLTTTVAKYVIYWSGKSTRLGVIFVISQDMRHYGVTGKLFWFNGSLLSVKWN